MPTQLRSQYVPTSDVIAVARSDELSDADLEHVVGGLARSFIDDPTLSVEGGRHPILAADLTAPSPVTPVG
jgi:hypothetical protein